MWVWTCTYKIRHSRTLLKWVSQWVKPTEIVFYILWFDICTAYTLHDCQNRQQFSTVHFNHKVVETQNVYLKRIFQIHFQHAHTPLHCSVLAYTLMFKVTCIINDNNNSNNKWLDWKVIRTHAQHSTAQHRLSTVPNIGKNKWNERLLSKKWMCEMAIRTTRWIE